MITGLFVIMIFVILSYHRFYFDMVNKSIPVSDKQEEETYHIQYDLKGGENSILNTERFRMNQLPVKLANAKKEGYHFSGWMDQNQNASVIGSLTEGRNYCLEAKWMREISSLNSVETYPYKTSYFRQQLPLNELNYYFLYSLDVPGNPVTKWKDYRNRLIDSANQCPQGICMVDDYIIITSYGIDEDALGTMAFYKKSTGEHIKTFGMDQDSHLGGIACDGKNLWICNSNNRELERISLAFIEKIIQVSQQSFIDISECFDRYPLKNIPSCICYDNGQLLVGSHTLLPHGYAYAYTFDPKQNTLKYQKKYKIPGKAQGIFVNDQGQIYISTSYGRTKSSWLYLYTSLRKMHQLVTKPLACVELPPGAEGGFYQEEMLYLLFETACSKYYEGSDGRGSCPYPIDKILVINEDSIFFD